MTRAGLTTLVQAIMDEATPFDENELVADTTIDGFLDKAAEEILLKVPLSLITPAELSLTGATTNADGSGQVLVPSDYLRLHSFKQTEWKEAVTKTITEQDPKFKLQKFTTTRGKPSKPVVVDMYYKKSSSVVRILRWFSIKSAAVTEYAFYVKSIGAFTTIADNIANVTAYQAAGNIFLSENRPDQAKEMYLKIDEFIKLYQ